MSRIIKESIDRLYEHDIHIETRTLIMRSKSSNDGAESGVDHDMATNLIKGLHIFSQTPTQPITIIMNNPGGDIYHGFAIYGAIKSCPCDVTIVVRGMAISAGSFILQAADHRILDPMSIMMIHPGEAGYHGHSKDFIKNAEQHKRDLDRMYQIYLDRIREVRPEYTKTQLERYMQFDRWLMPDEAIKEGLADKLVEYPVRAE